ncbi:unnamed protein product [Allacma fusca]|uniref:U3 small nucleolar RNA-interacting protein 2 n=1 Tax=Allacma fusca TaxID=39272 RepID=A0A8J2LNL0_9HEXA|nr:unnamed protein product [Allacma fusca]
MSFFIRKKDGGGGRPKLNNTDAKKRYVRPNRFENKRKFQNNNNQELNGLRETKKPKWNEEISSDSEDSELDERNDAQILLNEEEAETAQEKKIRLAKLYLEEIERKEREIAEDAEVDDVVSKQLQDDVLEAEGRLKKEVADILQADLPDITILRFPKHLKKSVTCLTISPDEEFIYSGCKDGHLIKWSVAEGKRVAVVKGLERLTKRKSKKGVVIESDGNSIHSSTITSIAITSDGKFLVTGDMDSKIVIWNPNTMKRIHIFGGHRKPIRGLVFRKNTHTLYSASDDKSVRIWSLDEMGYVETLFGHQDAVTSIDALSRERALSAGGRDGTLRVWKIVEESQLVYNSSARGSTDVVKLVNEENFVSASEDGSVSVWNVNRKKPLAVVETAHGICAESGQARWISSLASFTNTDLVASGSSDGFIRFWKCGERFKSLTEVFNVPCRGWVNSIEFSASGKFLVAGVGKEHRLGRWFQDKNAKNSVMIIPLSKK